MSFFNPFVDLVIHSLILDKSNTDKSQSEGKEAHSQHYGNYYAPFTIWEVVLEGMIGVDEGRHHYPQSIINPKEQN